jgi:hypothetical protein
LRNKSVTHRKNMNTIKHTASFEISQSIDTLFPLFSPEGEKLWVPGWDYENIMSTTNLHEDYVFLTKNHDHASTDAIWLVKKYEPESYRVQFYKVEPEDKIGIITVQCAELNNSRTKVQVTYQYIGLSEKGNEFVAKFSTSEYENFIAEWKSLLVKYFDSLD